MTENKYNSMIVVIPLSRGYSTIVDSCDGDLALYKWTATTHVYAARSSRIDKVNNGYLHRVIYARILGRPLKRYEHIDHIDCDKLNNRRSNLRLVTQANNNCNIKRRSNNKSGYKGVHFYTRLNNWRAEITKNGKRFCLGYFKSAELAYEAYCKAAVELHGEFARLS
jgi:bacillopeptidase F (M6 metalloprotease family)